MADVDGRIRLRRRRYNAQQLHKARPTKSIECASVDWPRLIHIEMLEEFVVSRRTLFWSGTGQGHLQHAERLI